jgi:nucleotide-binding universal stress UspA family protein
MKILLAADGSSYTKKALAWLVTNRPGGDEDVDILAVNVQPAMSPRVKTMVGAAALNAYHREEAEKVLLPIARFLERHDVGNAGPELVKVAKREKAHLIVMGTHGHGLIGRALMGSVAQNVVADCDIPVLLVK